MKLTFALLFVLLIAACSQQQPTHSGTVPAQDSTDTSSDAQQDVIATNQTAEVPGISVSGTTARLLNPELAVGQWAQYIVTTNSEDGVQESIRSYAVISFYERGDFCIGIERNSTVEGELRTRTMWCEDSKRILVWSSRRNEFSTQTVDADANWRDDAVRGFTTTMFNQTEQVTVPAGTFATINKKSWDGRVLRQEWHSPVVPGFEAGLVKSVVVNAGTTMTTELLAFQSSSSN